MADFEVHPIGTGDRLAAMEAGLSDPECITRAMVSVIKAVFALSDDRLRELDALMLLAAVEDPALQDRMKAVNERMTAMRREERAKAA
jgi:hypothetical protein